MMEGLAFTGGRRLWARRRAAAGAVCHSCCLAPWPSHLPASAGQQVVRIGPDGRLYFAVAMRRVHLLHAVQGKGRPVWPRRQAVLWRRRPLQRLQAGHLPVSAQLEARCCGKGCESQPRSRRRGCGRLRACPPVRRPTQPPALTCCLPPCRAVGPLFLPQPARPPPAGGLLAVVLRRASPGSAVYQYGTLYRMNPDGTGLELMASGATSWFAFAWLAAGHTPQLQPGRVGRGAAARCRRPAQQAS